MKYYISDTHFYHANAIGFDNRPWPDVSAMNAALVENWNSVVKKSDDVYVLGDFLWNKEDPDKILSKLTGHIFLVKGNHDRITPALERRCVWIKDYAEVKDGTHRVLLCHYPMLFYRSSYDPNKVMLCGHLHNSHENELLDQWTKDLVYMHKAAQSDIACHNLNCGNIINVGCMLHDYKPQTLDQLLRWHAERVGITGKEAAHG